MQQQWEDWGIRPEGSAELMVGREVAQLHPIPREVVYNLVMTTREFGTGLVINGGHAAIKSQKLELKVLWLPSDRESLSGRTG